MAGDFINCRGRVIESNKGIFKVLVDFGDRSETISALLSGNIKKNSIRVLVDDIVDVEISPYDMTKGRIKHRYKKGDPSLNE